MSRGHKHVTDINMTAIAQSVRLVQRRRRVPELATFRGEMQCRACSVSKITRSGQVVGVNVRLRNMLNTEPLGACRARVLSNIYAWIDNDRLACSFTRD